MGGEQRESAFGCRFRFFSKHFFLFGSTFWLHKGAGGHAPPPVRTLVPPPPPPRQPSLARSPLAHSLSRGGAVFCVEKNTTPSPCWHTLSFAPSHSLALSRHDSRTHRARGGGAGGEQQRHAMTCSTIGTLPPPGALLCGSKSHSGVVLFLSLALICGSCFFFFGGGGSTHTRPRPHTLALSGPGARARGRKKGCGREKRGGHSAG